MEAWSIVELLVYIIISCEVLPKNLEIRVYERVEDGRGG